MEYILKKAESFQEFPKDSKRFNVYIKTHIITQYLYSPDIQRELNINWTKDLKSKFDDRFLITGYYDFDRLHIADVDDKLYILNGQHRLNIICNDDKYKDITIEVRIFKCETMDEMNNLFLDVNGSKPCKIVESVSTQLDLNKIRKFLQYKYPMYIKPTNSPRRPHINLDTLVEHIEKSKLMEKYSADQIIEKIERKNSECYNSTPQQRQMWNWSEINFDKCKIKSPLHVFVLGLFKDYSWIYKLDDEIQINTRKNITKSLKQKVWNKRNYNILYGKCYVCDIDLNYDSFECGHITSVYHGGETHIDNLEPICRKCNSDMGTTNLENYKQNYRYQLNLITSPE